MEPLLHLYSNLYIYIYTPWGQCAGFTLHLLYMYMYKYMRRENVQTWQLLMTEI